MDIHQEKTHSKTSSTTSHKILPNRSEEEEHICLKTSDEEDSCDVTTHNYKHLFMLNIKLIEKPDKLEKSNI